MFAAGGAAVVGLLWVAGRFGRRGTTAALDRARRHWNVGDNQPAPFLGGTWRSYSAQQLRASGGVYSLLISSIVPRPIALVSTRGANGSLNCAPFSYFNAVSHDPPLIVIGFSHNRDGSKKDSLVNIEETGDALLRGLRCFDDCVSRRTCGKYYERLVFGVSKPL